MNNEWKTILKIIDEVVPEPGAGTRERARISQEAEDARQGHGTIQWDDLTIAQKTRFKEGIKCHHCDNKALWKCTNPEHGIDCFYDSRGNGQGIQVCEGQGPLTVDHLKYEKSVNSGHRWKSLKGVEPHKEFGYYKPPPGHDDGTG